MKIKKIFNSICKLNIIDLFKLLKMIEKKFNINHCFGSNIEKQDKVAKTYSLNLTSLGQSKIMVIKLIKEITNLSLIESKKISDSLPSCIIKDVEKKKAINIKKKFDEIGCETKIE
ncbi:ribosomal protein L7/L12 [Candidatus Vidania fulgoroideorum]